jgi:hypothetical protein
MKRRVKPVNKTSFSQKQPLQEKENKNVGRKSRLSKYKCARVKLGENY